MSFITGFQSEGEKLTTKLPEISELIGLNSGQSKSSSPMTSKSDEFAKELLDIIPRVTSLTETSKEKQEESSKSTSALRASQFILRKIISFFWTTQASQS